MIDEAAIRLRYEALKPGARRAGPAAICGGGSAGGGSWGREGGVARHRDCAQHDWTQPELREAVARRRAGFAARAAAICAGWSSRRRVATRKGPCCGRPRVRNLTEGLRALGIASVTIRSMPRCARSAPCHRYVGGAKGERLQAVGCRRTRDRRSSFNELDRDPFALVQAECIAT